jgi:glycosyltransferase involved in cell wall biosynthesis
MSTVLSLLDLNPRKFGSMEEFTLALSQQLRQRGAGSVLAFSHPLEPAIAARFRDSGSIFEVLDWRWGVRFYRELGRILKAHRPEVAHLHFYDQFSLWSALFLSLFLKIWGVKRIVYTDHCRQPVTFGPLKRLPLKLWNTAVPPLTGTRFIAISEHIKRVLTDCFCMHPGDIRVILNGVNIERFRMLTDKERARARARFGISEGHKVVCAVAALIPEKGISYLLQAAQPILDAHPDTVFLIAGDGRLSDQLAQEARDLGIAGHVVFLGLLPDVAELIATSDVVVVPSVWQEPAGLVVVEALASGRPVVATRVGGIPEYVEDGISGVLVEPRSAEQIALAVNKLLATPELAEGIGRAGRRLAVSNFTIERWVSETLEIYGIRSLSTRDVAVAASL